MRDRDDTSHGGDLVLYRPENGDCRFGGHYPLPASVTAVDRIPYGANRFVGMVNSQRSLHGVSERGPTTCVRRYINFYAETAVPNFDLPPLPLVQQALFWLRRRRSKLPGRTL